MPKPDPILEAHVNLLIAIINRARGDARGRFVDLGKESASAIQREARERLSELCEILSN